MGWIYLTIQMKYLKGSNKEKRRERVRAYPWSISLPLFKLFLFSCSYRRCSCCRRSSSRSRAMRSASLRRSWETRRPHSELKCNIKNIPTTLNFSQNQIAFIYFSEQRHLLYTGSLSFQPLPLQALPLQLLSLHLQSLSLPQQILSFFSLPHDADTFTAFTFSNFSTPLKKKRNRKKGKQFPHEKS